jgi:methylenetetrahydrofolate dehydrogenase (NADP+)/methenyltetrahydrofolate cyclohydrolase
MSTILDGKAVAQAVRAEVARNVEALRARGIVPGLATVLVGDDPASRVYVGTKERACGEVGMKSVGQRLPADTRTAELLTLVAELNRRTDVHGILVQLPLPAGIDSDAVVQSIAPEKDVDGLTATSQGRLLAGAPGLRPCTPLGIMRLIAEAGYASASPSRCCCSSSTRPSRCVTRGRGISRRWCGAPTSSWRRSAARA